MKYINTLINTSVMSGIMYLVAIHPMTLQKVVHQLVK